MDGSLLSLWRQQQDIHEDHPASCERFAARLLAVAPGVGQRAFSAPAGAWLRQVLLLHCASWPVEAPTATIICGW
jgi:hypothetical protein